MSIPEPLKKSLQVTATVTIAELYNEGKSAANDPEKFPLAEISEILDDRTCPLCQAVDGMILKVGTPEYAQWKQPSHIGCRRVLVYISKDEVGTEADFQAPDAELIRKHGHYHLNPDKHAEFKVPAEPAGRHFVVRRVKHPETGEVRTVLDWAPWHEQLPQWKQDLVLKARATSDEGELTEILGKLGIADRTDPEQLRQATLLGLKDRVEGWISSPASRPGMPGRNPLLPGPVDPALLALPDEARSLWTDAEYRRTVFQDLDRAYRANDTQSVQNLVLEIDQAVVAGLDALQLPRGPVRSVDIEPLQGASGEKRETCDLRVDNSWIETFVQRRRPEAILISWVHESIHGRQPFAPGWWFEYDDHPGYEEGLVEGLARVVLAEKARLRPLADTYNHYVRSYQLVAEVAQIDSEELLRELWKNRLGEVKVHFIDAIDQLRQGRGAQPLTMDQRLSIQLAADGLFADGQDFKVVNSRKIRSTWKKAFQ